MTGINPVGRTGGIAPSTASNVTLAQAARDAPTPDRTDPALDGTRIALDIVGIFEPTALTDLTNAGISMFRGDGWGALASDAGVIPYVGDAAKLGKRAQTITNAIDLARRNPGFAAAVLRVEG